MAPPEAEKAEKAAKLTAVGRAATPRAGGGAGGGGGPQESSRRLYGAFYTEQAFWAAKLDLSTPEARKR
ncbi:hypothetical protein TSOC_002160 [Tetrabaena socialis]|uniref:Uncharacterized protein n=1 Tax=Tetrabaena socialis TaxID=47790 RepID=A0A2J8AET7_9CHLO|nr:hypothetical protein TSOC_002160 [Tetrabaena socialis]|eukprot:PNH11019.1 hypothetical protein TSOC_002160 [Tetrabaena socialis]